MWISLRSTYVWATSARTDGKAQMHIGFRNYVLIQYIFWDIYISEIFCECVCQNFKIWLAKTYPWRTLICRAHGIEEGMDIMLVLSLNPLILWNRRWKIIVHCYICACVRWQFQAKQPMVLKGRFLRLLKETLTNPKTQVIRLNWLQYRRFEARHIQDDIRIESYLLSNPYNKVRVHTCEDFKMLFRIKAIKRHRVWRY